MRKVSIATLLLWAIPRAALAAASGGSSATPAASPAASTPVYDASAVPSPPPVDDPMLAPVPPPRRVVSSWAEALDLLRMRSTNLRTALDQVLQSEGQMIVAFAQYLPSLGGCAGGSSAPPGCANASYTHQLLTRKTSENTVGLVTSNVVPIPNTLTGALTLSQNIINVQEFDQISINELMIDSSRMTLDDIAAQTLEGLRRQALIQVEQAQRGITVAEVSYKVALEQRDLAALNDSMTQTAYTKGLGTSVDLVTASEAHRQAEQSLVVAEFGVVKGRLAAIMALSTCSW